MTREDEIRARLDAIRDVVACDPLYSPNDIAFCNNAPADLRYLLEKVERLEGRSVAEQFGAMTDDERAEVAAGFCRACWRNDPYCQCWKDE